MLYGIHLSTAGALAENARAENIANNLANLNTSGFRKDHLVFQQRLIEAIEGQVKFGQFNPIEDAIGGGVHLSETVTDFTSGDVRFDETGNAYDLAVRGAGFFRVMDEKGRMFYTRAGHFTRNTTGEVTTGDGRYYLTNRQGGRITVGSTFDVSADGAVSSDGTEVAQISSYEIPDKARIAKVGSNNYAYKGDESGVLPRVGPFAQGMLEMSAVNPVSEMVANLASQRAYEVNLRLVQIQDETLGSTINRVGRIA
ncbi:MAG: flagellar hook-basal body complex protein [Planctomycetes bacterium]|nr:flagellar hook-basal body complex protein [Planctomycetota bacterium]